MNTPHNAFTPAFPCEQGTDPNGNWNQTFESGLSKREYISALMLQGIVSNRLILSVDSDESSAQIKSYTEIAIACADYLLKKLNQEV